MAGILPLLRRRWLLALGGFLLTMAACVNVVSHAQPSYRSSSQMLFLLPPTSADPTEPPVNPYLNLPDGMGTMANLISGMVTTRDVQLELEGRGLTAQYTVVYLAQTGPILQIETTHTDPVVAARTRDALMDLVDADLAALQEQADTPVNQLMTATRPTVSKDPTVLYGAVLQAAGLTAVVGFLLVLLLCFTVDRRVRRRSQRAAVADPSVAARMATRVARIRRDPGLQVADEADEADQADEIDTSDEASAAAAMSHEPEHPDHRDEPASDARQLLPPLERPASVDAGRLGTTTVTASSAPPARVASQSPRYRDRTARRTARAAADELDAPGASGQARAGSLAG